MTNFKPLRKLIVLFSLITPLLFTACDKDGNPLYSDMDVRIQKDGVNYIHETPQWSLNNFVFSPKLTYNVHYITEEKDKRYIGLSSRPYKEGQRGNPEFGFSFYIPLEREVKLNSKYKVKPIGTVEEYILDDIQNSPFLGTDPYLLYTSYDDNKTFFGTGYIIFTKLYKEYEATIGEGKIEFSVPNNNGSRSALSGTFKLIMEGYPLH